MLRKPVPVVGSLCESDLGMDEDLISEIAEEVDAIKNSAANTNFKVRLILLHSSIIEYIILIFHIYTIIGHGLFLFDSGRIPYSLGLMFLSITNTIGPHRLMEFTNNTTRMGGYGCSQCLAICNN